MENFDFEKRKLWSIIPPVMEESLIDNDVIIAGGAITSLFTNREINDVDLYFRTWENLADFLYSLEGTGNIILSYTDKAVLIKSEKILFQAVCFDIFPAIEDIFNKFDFTVCMGAYSVKESEFYFHPDFLKDNSQRNIRFNPGTAFPLMSLLRVDKYKNKGYGISKTEVLRIALTCMNLKINSYDEVKEQIGGMYGLNIDNIIKHDNSEEFSIKNVLNDLQNLHVDDGYFINNDLAQTEISNFAKVVYDVTGIKQKIFKWGLSYYDLSGHIVRDFKNEMYDVGELFVTDKVYKYVRKNEDGRYFSHYKNSFEYRLGETIIPDSHGNLYFVFQYGINGCQYSNSTNSVLIECDVEKGDIITFSSPYGTVNVSKCKFIREVPKEEIEELGDYRLVDKSPVNLFGEQVSDEEKNESPF